MAMIKKTKAESVTRILLKITKRLREKIDEITLDMASPMNLIVRHCLGKAVKIIKHFHVQKLAYDTLSKMCIKHR